MTSNPMSELAHLPNKETQESARTLSLSTVPPVEPPDEPAERLVKSPDRVRDIGEVFTPSATVNEMLDLLPQSMWAVHPAATFLEPSCGDGNFIIAILNRKLRSIGEALKRSKLPAGEGTSAASFHALEALASIYAIDISSDNIIGGTSGHEIGARTRLLHAFKSWHKTELNVRLNSKSLVLRAAEWVVVHNLIVGNMLPVDSVGKPTGRSEIPLIEYKFMPTTRTVQLFVTIFGDVIASAEAEHALKMSLFGPVEPSLLWEGKALSLACARNVNVPKLNGPARNGKNGRR